MPVSRTSNRRRTLSGSFASALTFTITVPLSVNFTALLHRFDSTCSRRRASPMISPPAASRPVMEKPILRLFADTSVRLAMRFSTRSRSKGRISTFIWPASTLEKSRISLMMASSEDPASLMVLTISRWSGASSSRDRICVRPRMAFIGVRNSWLMCARNWLLAALAATNWAVRSATFCSSPALRSRMDCSARRRSVMSMWVPRARSTLPCASRDSTRPRLSTQRQEPSLAFRRNSISNWPAASFSSRTFSSSTRSSGCISPSQVSTRCGNSPGS